jgi:adenine/guanine phosphoribosyltransferase-like PRPP-binding protein
MDVASMSLGAAAALIGVFATARYLRHSKKVLKAAMKEMKGNVGVDMISIPVREGATEEFLQALRKVGLLPVPAASFVVEAAALVEGVGAQASAAYAALRAFDLDVVPRLLTAPDSDGSGSDMHVSAARHDFYDLYALLRCPPVFRRVLEEVKRDVLRYAGSYGLKNVVLVGFDKTLLYVTPVAMDLGLRVATVRMRDFQCNGLSKTSEIDGSHHQPDRFAMMMDVSVFRPTDVAVIVQDVKSTGKCQETMVAMIHEEVPGAPVYLVTLIDLSRPDGASSLLDRTF